MAGSAAPHEFLTRLFRCSDFCDRNSVSSEVARDGDSIACVLLHVGKVLVVDHNDLASVHEDVLSAFLQTHLCTLFVRCLLPMLRHCGMRRPTGRIADGAGPGTVSGKRRSI